MQIHRVCLKWGKRVETNCWMFGILCANTRLILCKCLPWRERGLKIFGHEWRFAFSRFRTSSLITAFDVWLCHFPYAFSLPGIVFLSLSKSSLSKLKHNLSLSGRPERPRRWLSFAESHCEALDVEQINDAETFCHIKDLIKVISKNQVGEASGEERSVVSKNCAWHRKAALD